MVRRPGQVPDQDREGSQFPEFCVCERCLASIDFGCCKGDVEHDRTSLAAVVFFHLLEQENTIDLVEEDSKKHLEAFWKFRLWDQARSGQLLWEKNYHSAEQRKALLH